jgi:hypothetical protein
VRWAAALVALAPSAAWACPACAREAPGSGTWALLGAMILVPYAVAVVVLKVIRKLDREP